MFIMKDLYHAINRDSNLAKINIVKESLLNERMRKQVQQVVVSMKKESLQS